MTERHKNDKDMVVKKEIQETTPERLASTTQMGLDFFRNLANGGGLEKLPEDTIGDMRKLFTELIQRTIPVDQRKIKSITGPLELIRNAVNNLLENPYLYKIPKEDMEKTRKLFERFLEMTKSD